MTAFLGILLRVFFEAATLTWANVDMAGGVIRLRAEHAKSGHARFLALDDSLRALLARRWQARTIAAEDGTTRVVDLVFHRGGGPIGDFRKAWATACITAGLYHVVTDADGTERKLPARLVHDLRRTAVRDMIRAGVRPDIAMKISRHRTQAMRDRYNIGDEQDVREAVARTADYRAARPRDAKVVTLRTAAEGAAR